MANSPMTDTTGYWGDEEVDYYRDQVFLYTDQVLDGVLLINDVPQEYIEDVIDRIFYEKTGRKYTVSSYQRLDVKKSGVQSLLGASPVDMSTPHCSPDVYTSRVDMSNL